MLCSKDEVLRSLSRTCWTFGGYLVEPLRFPFRLDETLNLNGKLDQSVRKKEENIRTLEKTLQANETR